MSDAVAAAAAELFECQIVLKENTLAAAAAWKEHQSLFCAWTAARWLLVQKTQKRNCCSQEVHQGAIQRAKCIFKKMMNFKRLHFLSNNRK